MNYKHRVYNSYRTAFKGANDGAKSRFISGKMYSSLKRWIRNIDKELPVADLGCGSGELLLALKENGFKFLSGCDLSREQVNAARSVFPEVSHSGLMEFLQHSENDYFGLIILFDVVEHLSKQETFDLMELVLLKLRPGGSLLVHTPNGLSPFAGQVLWGDLTHEWCLTPLSAYTLCKMYGLTDFEALENLGAGNGPLGILRVIIWAGLRVIFQMYNLIETGTVGGNVWTRNFVFRARKAK